MARSDHGEAAKLCVCVCVSVCVGVILLHRGTCMFFHPRHVIRRRPCDHRRTASSGSRRGRQEFGVRGTRDLLADPVLPVRQCWSAPGVRSVEGMAPRIGITGRPSTAQQARDGRHGWCGSRKSLKSGGSGRGGVWRRGSRREAVLVVRLRLLRLGVGNRGCGMMARAN